MKFRALVDLSIRDDKGVLQDVKAGAAFKPPKKMLVDQAIERGYIEAVEEVKKNED
jgi:hypothetical protein